MENNSELNSSGSLIFFKDIKESELQFIIDYLSSLEGYTTLKALEVILDRPEKLVEVLDILAGYRVKFPDRQYLAKLLTNVRIWNYLKEHSLEPDDVARCAGIYGKKKKQCVDIYNRYEEIYKSVYGEDSE